MKHLLEKTLMLGKIEGGRRRGRQRMRRLGGITDSTDMGLGGLRELLTGREAWRASVHGVAQSRTRVSGCLTAAQKPSIWDSALAMEADILVSRPTPGLPRWDLILLQGGGRLGAPKRTGKYRP